MASMAGSEDIATKRQRWAKEVGLGSRLKIENSKPHFSSIPIGLLSMTIYH